MIGPAIAIEKQLAPNVVNPPCASKIAWKINTMIPKILVTHGPNKIAPRPVPVIWEQLPVTEGIFKDESTNTKAPVKASTVRVLLSFPSTFLIFIKPITKNGTQITPHKIQYFTGRNPSMMCIADAPNLPLAAISDSSRQTARADTSTRHPVMPLVLRFCKTEPLCLFI